MPSETREWSVPTPIRALLWWPAVSFALVVIVPDASAGLIISSGLGLALLGVALSVVAGRLQRSTPVAESTAVDFPVVDFPTVEFPVPVTPETAEERAA